MKKIIYAIVVFSIGLLTLPFNNCSSPYDTDSTSSEGQSQDLPAINYLKNPKPNPLCGQSGYKYLLNEYFQKNCGTCHQQGGLDPRPFADMDIDIAFNSIRFIPAEKLLLTVEENRFCGPDCNLSKHGEVYQAILEWLNQRHDCP